MLTSLVGIPGRDRLTTGERVKLHKGGTFEMWVGMCQVKMKDGVF